MMAKKKQNVDSVDLHGDPVAIRLPGMKKTVKKRWIEALRSGEYKQGREYLCANTKQGGSRWCCLGVLADVAVDADWIYIPRGRHGVWSLGEPRRCNAPSSPWSAISTDELLSDPIREKLGMTTHEMELLAGMNDSDVPFKTIASKIEIGMRGAR